MNAPIKSIQFSAAVLTSSCLLIFAGAGCEIKQDSAIANYRSQLKLQDRPGEVAKIGDAQTSVKENSGRVTIIGKADLNALPSNSQPKAVMLVREIIADSHGHGSDHDASSCAFCRRRQEQAPKAAVEFVGKDGKALPYTVQSLFGINDGDEVVVVGDATLDTKAEMLKVTATGLYFKSAAK